MKVRRDIVPDDMTLTPYHFLAWIDVPTSVRIVPLVSDGEILRQQEATVELKDREVEAMDVAGIEEGV